MRIATWEHLRPLGDVPCLIITNNVFLNVLIQNFLCYITIKLRETVLHGYMQSWAIVTQIWLQNKLSFVPFEVRAVGFYHRLPG